MNHHHRQAGAFALRQVPGLTGNYSPACLIAMEIDFLQIATSTQALAACLPALGLRTALTFLTEASGPPQQQEATLWLENSLPQGTPMPWEVIALQGSVSSPWEL